MPATAAPMSGTYHGLTPTRILDTRIGIGVVAGVVSSGHEAVLTVAGLKSVPTTASAVVLNVTVSAPTGTG